MTKTLPDHTDIAFFLLAIVLSVLLRYTDSDNPFGIFKLFFHQTDFTSFNLIDRNLSSFYFCLTIDRCETNKIFFSQNLNLAK